MNIIRGFKFTILTVILILIAILMPTSGVPTVEIPYADKIVHTGMFVVLTGCFYIEYLMQKNKLPSTLYVLISIGVFAILTEVLQSLTPDRTMDIWDLGADLMGSIATIGIIKLWYKKKSQLRL